MPHILQGLSSPFAHTGDERQRKLMCKTDLIISQAHNSTASHACNRAELFRIANTHDEAMRWREGEIKILMNLIFFHSLSLGCTVKNNVRVEIRRTELLSLFFLPLRSHSQRSPQLWQLSGYQQLLVLPKIYSASFDVQFTPTNFAWNRFRSAAAECWSETTDTFFINKSWNENDKFKEWANHL